MLFKERTEEEKRKVGPSTFLVSDPLHTKNTKLPVGRKTNTNSVMKPPTDSEHHEPSRKTFQRGVGLCRTLKVTGVL